LLKQDLEIDDKAILQQELVKTLISYTTEVLNMLTEQETKENKGNST
jgi:hypothetical protein